MYKGLLTPSESECESENFLWSLEFFLWSLSIVLWSFLLSRVRCEQALTPALSPPVVIFAVCDKTDQAILVCCLSATNSVRVDGWRGISVYNPLIPAGLFLIEFFLNDYLSIQRIHRIMTKSNTSMVTRDILHLTIVTFLDVVVKKNFPVLPVDWYPFWVVTDNRYLPRGSNKNALFITSTGNVSVSRWVII